MDCEKYFTEQAEAFLELVSGSQKRPIHKKTTRMLHGEKAVLLYLSEREAGVTAGELSRALEIGSGGVANVLNALEKKGLIVRKTCPDDRRKVIVSLSEKGRDGIAAHRREVLSITTLLLERLGKEDTAELLRIFRRLIAIGDALYREKTEETNHVETF